MPTAVSTAYQESSQFLRWTLSTQELDRRRVAVNEAAVAEIRENIAEELRLSPGAKDQADFPSVEEANIIVEFYATKVFDTGSVFNLPSHLKATAAAYVKRFYLAKSPLHYHPKSVMITSLFLATKTCEHHVDLDLFVSKLPKQTRDSVLDLEFLISSVIGFDFVFWSAYRPLYGFMLDMEATLLDGDESLGSDGDVNPAALNRMHESAKGLINATVWSDLPFLSSPSQLAMAALYRASASLVERYLKMKGREEQIFHVMRTAEELQKQATVSLDKPEHVARVKAIDKKLYYSRDPALKKDTALYKRRIEAEEKEGVVKRRKKGDAVREAQEAFGSVMS